MTDLSPNGATPTRDTLQRRFADFETLGDALDYAATGTRGMNFHDARGTLTRAYPYATLREDSLAHARRFITLGLAPGDRVALVAETGAEFAACFFGAVYAGLWPVPLPLPTSFGGREAYVAQLLVMLESSDPQLFLYPPELADFSLVAAAQQKVVARDWDSLAAIEQSTADLPTNIETSIAYLQYSSGSTRFPHGVAVTHRALLDNLHAHGVGVEVAETDRVVSWLPWYHDMGLVGCMLSPVANQLSADYLKTEDFARRPLAWLDLVSRNPGTTLSYSPTFGYDICARRLSSITKVEDRFDLSRWRIAGNGADMIRPDVMQAFVDSFAAALGNELKDTGVTVTCLKPGATETEFFTRADMDDTKVGQSKKADASDVAKLGWNAMKQGDHVATHGLMNKVQVLAAGILPESFSAQQGRKVNEPGSGVT